MKKWFLCFSLVIGLCACNLQAEDDNAIIVCDNGLEMFSWDLEFIRNAQYSIEVSACFAGGTIIQELLNEIEARLEVCPELQVYILTTPVLLEHENKKIISRLEKTYPNRFHMEHATSVMIIWPDVTGIDNHVKMLIVDETYFSAGGTNLDQSLCSEGTYTPPRNKNKQPPMGDSLPAGARDQDIVGRGSLAKDLRKNFYKLYAIWQHFSKTQKLERDPDFFADKSLYRELDFPDKPFVEKFEISPELITIKSPIKMLVSGPHQKKNVITSAYIELINEAKEEIWIGNLYFCPVEPLFQALLNAVNRGVKLTLITNGISDSAPSYNKCFCWANRVEYVPIFYGKNFHFWDAQSCSKLSVKKTKIYEYHVDDILYHKKVMVVDGKKFLVGSYNLGFRSDLSDYELALVFDSPEIAMKAKRVFEKDIHFSQEISPKQARDWYFDPFTAYLGEVQKKFHGLL